VAHSLLCLVTQPEVWLLESSMPQKFSPSKPISIRFRRILFATDFSETSAKALPYAAAIASHFGATVHVVHVITPDECETLDPCQRDAAMRQMRQGAEQRIRALLSSSHFASVPHEVVIEEGNVEPILSSVARDRGIDLIVAGTHGRHGLGKLLSGSIAEEISEVVSLPILLVGPEIAIAPEMAVRLERILYATDFSPESRTAMDFAFALAQEYRGHLFILHVAEDVWQEPLSTRMPANDFIILRLLERGWREHPEGIETEFLVDFGAPEPLILEAVQKLAIQLVVLGLAESRHPQLAAHLPGPLFYNVASHCRCPVLIVPGGKNA
jgi:nucleotide-binding universal stress UspA family protein